MTKLSNIRTLIRSKEVAGLASVFAIIQVAVTLLFAGINGEQANIIYVAPLPVIQANCSLENSPRLLCGHCLIDNDSITKLK